MSFLRFLADPKLGGFTNLSPPQRVLAKILGNEPMETEQEKNLYRHHTGMEWSESTPRHNKNLLLCGRRGGKSRIAANFAVYETILGGHEKYLAEGEAGTFLVSAQDKSVSQDVIFRYCKSIIQNSPFLKKYLESDPIIDTIRLKVNDKSVQIKVLPARDSAVRGWTLIGMIGDEAAKWRAEGANVDKEIMDAVIPASATIPDATFNLVTTPWSKIGLVYDIFKENWAGTDDEWLVFKATTLEMNTGLTPKARAEIERSRLKDREWWLREYCAEFSDQFQGWLPGVIVDEAVDEGITFRPYVSKNIYLASMDPAFIHDRYTFHIVHKEPDDTVVQDHAYEWSADGKNKAVDAVRVIEHISNFCKKYKIRTLRTDQGSSEVIEQMFNRSSAWLGTRCRFEKIHVTNAEKRDEFKTLKDLLLNGKMRLLDHERTIHELKNLEVKLTGNGGIQISAPRMVGYSDDHACALAMAVHYACVTAPAADHKWEAVRLSRHYRQEQVGANDFSGWM